MARRYHQWMAQDHDTGYKQLFSHPEMVRDLLAGFVPYPWTKALDVSAFERVNASYASDTGHQRHDDMVWRLKLGADWVYVYILLEFQSRNDRWMALRMQVYVGLLCQDLVKRRELTVQGKLPPVLPIVLYSGAARWRASTDLGQLMLAPPEGLAPLQPEQRYLLIDQSSYDMAMLEQRNVIAAVFRLQRSRAYKDVRNVIASLVEWLGHSDCEPLRNSLARWISAQLQRQFSAGAAPALSEELSEVDIMLTQEFKSWEDEWEHDAIQKGLQQGLEQGRNEGRQEGKLDADRARLRSLLQRRFGNMLPDIAARINEAPPSQIEYWYDRLFDASSLEEIFAYE